MYIELPSSKLSYMLKESINAFEIAQAEKDKEHKRKIEEYNEWRAINILEQAYFKASAINKKFDELISASKFFKADKEDCLMQAISATKHAILPNAYPDYPMKTSYKTHIKELRNMLALSKLSEYSYIDDTDYTIITKKVPT